MPSTTNLGAVLNINSLSNATQRARYTWRTTKLTFQSTSASSWRSSSSFLSFCPISIRKPPSCANTSSSSQVENENVFPSSSSSSSSSPAFTSIEQTTSRVSSPSDISNAVSAAAGNNEKDIEFNLPWAVALAGAAFESYADVAVRGLVQQCPGGVEITYTNKDFLRDNLAGLLKITIDEICLKSSVEVESKDTQNDSGHEKEKEKEMSMSSFVCKLSIGDGCLELQPPASGDDNFGESTNNESSGYLFVRNLERDRLSVRLIDKKEDSDAGVASLIAPEFVEALKEKKKKDVSENRQSTEEKVVEISLDLQDKELNLVGFMRLKLDFKPFSDVFVASIASQSELNLLGSPGPALMSQEWQSLTSKVLEASSAAFEPVAFIENHETDTQVWFFINKPLKQLVVSFRGTVQDSWKDLLTDISMTPISLETRHMKEAPRHAALAKLSAEPGTINKVMQTVAHAKKEIELKKQAAKKAAETAANSSQEKDFLEKGEEAAAPAAIESREAAEKEAEGLVSSAVGAVKATTSDIQDFIVRLKYLIDQGAIEGPRPAHKSAAAGGGGEGDIWVHSGFLTAYDSVRGAVLGLIDTALANSSSNSQDNAASEANTSSQQSQQQQQQQQETSVGAEESSKSEVSEGPWTVLFTGHSLGGALATLAAFDFSHRSSTSRRNNPPKIAMYNFGSPRVGNKAFATEFNRAVQHAWRLVNRNDAVVTVPRLVGYCHVGHAVIVGLDPETHNKKIEVQLHSSEAPFEGMAVVDEVLPAVGAAIAHAVGHAVPAVMKGVGLEIAAAAAEGDNEKKDRNLEEDTDGNGNQDNEEEQETTAKLTSEQLAEYWEQEKEAWTALFYGTAISEHMEEFYFKGIEDAVDEWRQQRVASSSQARKTTSEEQEDNNYNSNIENEQQNQNSSNNVGKEEFGIH
ncbi:putative Phospholipase A(1) DAD1, chloroplastic [Nannochloris sp. 'desiccata']|nr:putative Phospholipase A(1) DAD1, chloroplastic [Chlorella desiccata (nom. nud.)]